MVQGTIRLVDAKGRKYLTHEERDRFLATAPLVEAFGDWLKQQRARVSPKSRLGEKLAYIARHWDGLRLFLADGRVEPYAWLKATLEAIATGHPNSRIDELLPWNSRPPSS